MRFLSVLLWLSAQVTAADAVASGLRWDVDTLTRDVQVTYTVPANAPEEVLVTCAWSPAGKGDWRPAGVTPFISETARELARDDQWREWMRKGRIVERRAAGMTRTVLWNPYPDAHIDGRVDADFRLTLAGRGTTTELMTAQVRIQADNRDVVYVEDWSRVLQADQVRTQAMHVRDASGGDASAGDEPDGWCFRTGAVPEHQLSRGDGLFGKSPPDRPLAQLTWAADLKGWYAIFVATQAGAGSPGIGSIRLRLSGDEAADTLGSRHLGEEVLWKWARMDRQHLVIRQPHLHTGYVPAHVDYVKLVPIPPEQVASLDSQFGEPDKLVAGYWEPYSWAFNEEIHSPAQHREPLLAFTRARIGLVDMQIGRVGMKVVYESRATDQLVHGTFGDPIEGDARPVTTNVGRMQQYTNTLGNELAYGRELGLNLHANLGAGACYTGTPLQGDISKTHPDWRRGNTLRYELPEVRAYVADLFREALEIGAPALSIDFCRYPEGVDTPDTCNTLLRELRSLADVAGRERNARVPILVRFPGTGVRLHERFDYRTWAKERLVDYLCPSNIQGRHLHIDITPYMEAVRGTDCKLLPALDGLNWGLPMPGMFFERVRDLYAAGVPGIYVYQSDARVLGRPAERRWMRLLASSGGVNAWWQRLEHDRPRCTKGIYLSRPEAPGGAYHGYERVRVWLEGLVPGSVEFYLDDKLVNTCDAPPHLLGTEGYESDKLIPRGRHTLRVRAVDGDGWFEERFEITGG